MKMFDQKKDDGSFEEFYKLEKPGERAPRIYGIRRIDWWPEADKLQKGETLKTISGVLRRTK